LYFYCFINIDLINFPLQKEEKIRVLRQRLVERGDAKGTELNGATGVASAAVATTSQPASLINSSAHATPAATLAITQGE